MDREQPTRRRAPRPRLKTPATKAEAKPTKEPPKKRGAFDEVYRIVRKIPRGRVMTYGQIADRLARPLTAKAVGWAMRACPPTIPWHRVVNAEGRCSADRLSGSGEQTRRLEAEGIRFEDGALDLARHRYRPR